MCTLPADLTALFMSAASVVADDRGFGAPALACPLPLPLPLLVPVPPPLPVLPLVPVPLLVPAPPQPTSSRAAAAPASHAGSLTPIFTFSAPGCPCPQTVTYPADQV